MGGSQSAPFDYEKALLNRKSPIQSAVVGGAEDEEKGFGLPRTNLKSVNGLMDHAVSRKDPNVKAYTLWEAFQIGKSYNPDAPFLGTRQYQVAPKSEAPAAEEPAPVAEDEEKKTDKKKAKKPSGYVERADGSIQRYEYVWDSYKEVEEASINIGRALVSLGAQAKDNIGIFSINRAEWLISSFGFYSQNMRTVSLYATLGPDAIEYIINHAGTQFVFVSKENLPGLKRVVDKIVPTVKHIIVFDPLFNGRYGNTLDAVQQADVDFFKDKNIELHGLSDIIALGATKTDIAPNLPTAEDIAFIMYTSGTTGVPKGAIISHNNVVAVGGAINNLANLEVGDAYFSYLPLAHIFETAAQAYIWTIGGQIAFSQGDIRYLADDLQKARPMLFCGVPRVFLKFYQNIWANVEKLPCLKRSLTHRAFAAQCEALRTKQPLEGFYNDRIFSMMRLRLGLDRVKILITGAAPCPPYLIEFMRVVTNAYFAQGYGMTEGSAGTAVTLRDDNLCGNVGPPLANNMVRLADIPDMNYFSTDEHPRGEILIHGPSVFKGYYKNDEATADTLKTDSKGRIWLHTGDVGRWNPDGTLSIIDRKKNIIKLQQGEYVPVEKVEDTYGKAPCISQIWCYGNSYKSVMVGVVVLNAQPLYQFAKDNGFIPADTIAPVPGSLTDEFRAVFKSVITGPNADAVKAWVAGQLKAQEQGLLGFEKMKDFYIEPEVDSLGQGFSEENDCMTPTMKKKRKQLTDKYIPELKRLYTGLGEKPMDGEKW